MLTRYGVAHGFLEVPLLGPKKQSTSFKVRGRDFRVDLITPKTGRGDSPKFVPPVKSYAETVRFLEFVLEDTQKAVMLAKAGVVVNVPNPARFALHKLVVSGRRSGAQRIKSNKDVKQATQIIAVLLEQRPGDLWLALDAAAKFHDKFLKALKACIKQLDERVRPPLTEQIERNG